MAEDLSAAGDLDVHSNIVVEGHGATIDARRTDRVIEHHRGSLRLVDVEITGGAASAPDRRS